MQLILMAAVEIHMNPKDHVLFAAEQENVINVVEMDRPAGNELFYGGKRYGSKRK